jgi:uncharacterized protein YjaZ
MSRWLGIVKIIYWHVMSRKPRLPNILTFEVRHQVRFLNIKFEAIAMTVFDSLIIQRRSKNQSVQDPISQAATPVYTTSLHRHLSLP